MAETAGINKVVAKFIGSAVGIAVGLAALYLFAAHDTRRYSGIVAVAIAGRLLGGLALGVAAVRGPGLEGLYPLAAADAAFGLAHAAFWLPIRS